MNTATATDSRTRLTETEVRALGQRAFEGLGLNAADARDVVDVLVLADLFGLSTHGLSRVESYGERLDVGGIAKTPAIAVERVAPALVTVDGANGVGPLVGMHGLRAAMEVARECGIGAAFVRGSNHFGPISPYSFMAAEQGFASMIGSNATTTIAPWGGSDARLGNSPLGFGVPGAEGRHFMLDMAMSVVARAKIRNALKAGESIPDTWGTDKQGRATTDPKAALDGFLQPIGGHKGYGLALIVGLLAGTLQGAAMGREVVDFNADHSTPTNTGQAILVLDLAAFGGAAPFKAAVDTLVRDIRDSERLPGVERIWLPGEQSHGKRAAHEHEGAPLPLALVEDLDRLAARLGIAPLQRP